jgi:hypothetical protein
MKKCFKCKEDKPLSEFYKHKGMSDGHLNKCKTCTKLDVHNHRHGSGRLKVLEYDRLRAKNPERIEKQKKINKAWEEKYPMRRKAQRELGKAVARCEIKPLPCFVCGEKAEAHHPDYDRPLDVIWLCPSHHKQIHSQSLKEIK